MPATDEFTISRVPRSVDPQLDAAFLPELADFTQLASDGALQQLAEGSARSAFLREPSVYGRYRSPSDSRDISHEICADLGLALQLALLCDIHRLESLVVTDRTGRPVASAGDVDFAQAFGLLASVMMRGQAVGADLTLHCGRIYLAAVTVRGVDAFIAARSRDILMSEGAIVRDVLRVFGG